MPVADIKHTRTNTTDEYEITGGGQTRARYWRDARSPSGAFARVAMWVLHSHENETHDNTVTMELHVDGHKRLTLIMNDEMLCNLRDVVSDVEATVQGANVHRIVEVV